jgi:hypothetical protein
VALAGGFAALWLLAGASPIAWADTPAPDPSATASADPSASADPDAAATETPDPSEYGDDDEYTDDGTDSDPEIQDNSTIIVLSAAGGLALIAALVVAVKK